MASKIPPRRAGQAPAFSPSGAPPILGGQGRSNRSISDGAVMLWLVLAATLAVLVLR